MFDSAKYFSTYVSNTTAGTTTQYWFETDGSRRKGRVYYKIFHGGKFEYSLLYTNILDSTFAEGKDSACNNFCGPWTVHSLKVGLVDGCGMDDARDPDEFKTLYFDGKEEKQVGAGEIFATDPFELEVSEGGFICLEMEFSGALLPCHQEIQIAVFGNEDGKWVHTPQVPVPSMIGCKREVKHKIGFLGDSITQGIGATQNGYRHWNSQVAEILGRENSYWNLGIGYARAGDAATDGVWLYKVKQCELVVVCLGTNDLRRTRTVEEIAARISRVVRLLKAAGKTVIIQTLPPFDLVDESRRRWYYLNDFIKREVVPLCDGFFDNVPLLRLSEEEPYRAKFGGHPNDEGCAVWGKALAEYMKEFI